MKIEQLKGKKIAILGFSIEGLSTAKFLDRHHIHFTILEKNPPEKLTSESQAFLKDFRGRVVTGVKHLKNLAEFDLISRSQGIPLWLPELVEAKKRRTEITSATKIFFEFCPCPIIGITGTKGKGTTATLIYEMLKSGGQDVFLGGNIGISPLDFLDELETSSKVVLELSSFQLEDLDRSPHLSVVLMTTSEHLNSQAPDSPNFHRSAAEYLEAKRNIVRFQSSSDIAVANYDFENSRKITEGSSSKIFYYSAQSALDEGAFVEQGWLVFRRNRVTEKICRAEDIFLRGVHNLQNVLAASAAALLSGADLEKVVSVIKSFRGLEHRLEFVRELNGVKYYNDSFSTTPETCIAAIKSFTEPEILILGGSEKGSDYKELGEVVNTVNNIKAVLLIGTTASKIKSAITEAQNGRRVTVVEGLVSMGEIMTKSFELSEPGDVVILSPACASFDMFKNYKERGQQFKKFVNRL